MADENVIQSVGNVVARDLRARYPEVKVFFFAPRNWEMMRVHIADKRDRSGRTGRLFDIGSVHLLDTMTAKEMICELEPRIEQRVREFIETRKLRA